MRTIRNIAGAVALLIASNCAAIAQSSPGLIFGQIPTAGQWNSYFAAKQDVLGYTPVNKAGDVMIGPLITAASTTSLSGFSLPHGAAPTSPANGDLWTTTAGLFVRINGVTSAVSLSGGSPNFTTPVTINLTGGAIPTADTGALLIGSNASGVISRIELTSYGAASIVTGRASNGTFASPTTLTSGTLIASFNAHGYDGTAWATTVSAAFRAYAEATWSNTSHPTEACLSTTPSASTTIADVFCIHANTTASLAGTQMLIGAATTNLTVPLVVHAGTEQNFTTGGHVALATGAAIGSVNDANTVLQPLEVRASQTSITQGGVVIAGNALAAPNVTSLAISANASASPSQSAPAGTGLWMLGANGANDNVLVLDQFGGGAGNANIAQFRAGAGTAAAPTALASGQTIAALKFSGYTGSTFYTSAQILLVSNEVFSGTAGGADLSFNLTPNTTQARAQAITMKASGCLAVGTTADCGIGSIIANGAIFSTQHFGGSAAGSTLALAGTSNGSPSGAKVTINSNGQQTFIGGQTIVGATSTSQVQTFQVHTGTNQNFLAGGAILIGSGIIIGSDNDAANAILPMEIRASQVNYTQGGVVIASNIAPTPPSATSLTVSANASASPSQSAPAGTLLWGLGTDGANDAALTLDQYGTGVANRGTVNFRLGAGTAASPTAAASGSYVGAFKYFGYTGTTFYNTVFVGAVANETFSGTAGGADFQVFTTPNTTHAIALSFSVRASGGVSVGSAADTGINSLSAADVYTANATFLVRTKATLTAGSTANVPTLTSGPVTGNPTKWISIDDNGTTRRIPAW